MHVLSRGEMVLLRVADDAQEAWNWMPLEEFLKRLNLASWQTARSWLAWCCHKGGKAGALKEAHLLPTEARASLLRERSCAFCGPKSNPLSIIRPAGR